MIKERYYLSIFLFTLLMATLLSACSQVETTDAPSTENNELAVSFDSYLRQSQDTRANYPTYVGDITESNAQLKETGFGVFAAYTHAEEFVFSGSNYTPADALFNFMYNQQVKWNNSLDDSYVTQWTYAPVKYWPNDNNPADDEGAIGSQEHSYVSFYAYAPWVDDTTLPATPADTDNGIIGMTQNDNAAGDSYLTYRTTTLKAAQSVDLLWAAQSNLFKTKDSGEGYTNGNVTFNFIHALSKLTVTVQGLFDHINNDDHSPYYPENVDGDNTKILIKEVKILSPTVYSEGKMYLAPRPDDATVPDWFDFKASNEASLDFEGETIHSDLRYTSEPTHRATADGESDPDEFKTKTEADIANARTDFEALPEGVTHTEHTLFESTDPYYLFPPTSGNAAQPLTVNIVYDVITYDEHLTLNNPRYYSIVENNITYTSTEDFAFHPNRVYTLRLQPGLTTVKFEVEEMSEWGRTIILSAEVKDWQTQTNEYDVKHPTP